MVSKAHTMTLWIFLNENSQIVKITFAISRFHLQLDHHVKIHEKYEWLYLYIMMIEKWDSKIRSKTSTNDCKWIVRYFAKIFVLQHTDQTKKK